MATPRVWGGDSEQSINSVNQWMRQQPWYTRALASFGQDPSSVRLSKAQTQQLLRVAQANGVQVDEGSIEVDPAGNFNPKGHKLRNTLIGAGVAGAAGAGRNVLNTITGAANTANTGTDWVRTLAPLLGLGATAATGGFRSPQVGIDPTLQSQINALLQQQTDRAARTTPIHEAAMRLASQLAPTSNTSPRLQSAIEAAGRPVQQPGMDPQVAEAMARLMGSR